VILEDVQDRPDTRGIAIEQVGISGLRYPISVLDRGQAKQDTIASVSMTVDVSAEVKGAHLSRFVEVLEAHVGELTQRTLPSLLSHIQRHLGAATARIALSFPYFLARSAPVSGMTALMDYECSIVSERAHDRSFLEVSVRVPVTSVCPCSKAISDYGAHNQRGYITITVVPKATADDEFELIWFEELIDIAEGSASSPVYPLLKRSDERFVTMKAYDNPVFVEDMVRSVACALQVDDRISTFSVEAVNDESIHNHAAFARLLRSNAGAVASR
jgi:GTP cyclohydrolase IB